MIRYDRLWATMEAQGMTQYRLIKHYNFSAGQIGRLRKTCMYPPTPWIPSAHCWAVISAIS